MSGSKLVAIVSAATLLAMITGRAESATVTIPNDFKVGAKAKASDVNANFSALATAVNGSANDIATLQQAIQSLQKAQAALGFTFRGPWTSTAVYSVNDVTTAGGSSYIALKSSVAADPAIDVSASGGNWALFAGVGEKGSAGATGPQGPVGPPGPTGATGPAGAAGTQGPVGPQGMVGPAGPTGAAGATGPAGAPGPTGAAGPAGATGAAGAQGPIGATGPAGLTGQTGAMGPQGPAGTIPSNLTALSSGLGTSGYGNENRGTGTGCTIGDIILSVNSYGLGTYLPADGAVLSIQANSALFSILGVKFGGNGTTNFTLPDLRPFAPENLQYSICVSGLYPSTN
jgi:hypothetical protein